MRRPALFTLLLALHGVAVDPAGAATVIQIDNAPRRWRVVDPGGEAPRSQLIPAALPPATVPATAEQRTLPPEPDQALPADAQVAAAPIRPAYLIRPSLGGGLPAGYVGGWGDYFLSASAGTRQGGDADASFNMGFGIGDPERLLGAEIYLGIGSFKTFNANGSFGASIGRLLVNSSDLQLGVAGGVIDAYSYGNEANPQPINGYGAITAALPLRRGESRPPRAVQFTLGGGGSSFASIDSSYELSESGLFGAAGIEVLENLGFSVGVSGRSTNVVLSWIPLRTVPIFVNLMAADVFATTPWGTIGVLTMGWGDNLKNGFVTK